MHKGAVDNCIVVQAALRATGHALATIPHPSSTALMHPPPPRPPPDRPSTPVNLTMQVRNNDLRG